MCEDLPGRDDRFDQHFEVVLPCSIWHSAHESLVTGFINLTGGMCYEYFQQLIVQNLLSEDLKKNSHDIQKGLPRQPVHVIQMINLRWAHEHGQSHVLNTYFMIHSFHIHRYGQTQVVYTSSYSIIHSYHIHLSISRQDTHVKQMLILPQITRPCELDDKLIIISMGSWAWANPCIKYAFNTSVFPHSLKYILDGMPMKNRR